ncbi:MAG: site-specific DNA-methyltransferase [Lentisphaeria bacterium]|nr:site-specific DNA-methyltransferase [Lentisphaeria bacterium]
MIAELTSFREYGTETVCSETYCAALKLAVPTFTNEFWTAKQRAAHSLHEISYRACFKPQLPRFFIDRLTRPGDTVYDPFMGRGTTPVEAGLRGRLPFGCDVNPLCSMLTEPRLTAPDTGAVERTLASLDLHVDGELPEDLLVFYHPDTLRELCALRRYFARPEKELTAADRWLRMVALNRLTGHSAGFFSVYTLPPNQAVSVAAQRKINEKRHQTPEYRDVRELILRKSRALWKDCGRETPFFMGSPLLLAKDNTDTPEIRSDSVSLVVTSPPFLDVVDYKQDNWLRNWFASIDGDSLKITIERTPEGWQRAMTRVFRELRRVLKPGGHLAFEVGEIRHGSLRMEDLVFPAGAEAGLAPQLLLVNEQKFTKTAQCWGVDNQTKGTNTNRIVLFRKE